MQTNKINDIIKLNKLIETRGDDEKSATNYYIDNKEESQVAFHTGQRNR
ncbi:hypothetical protein MNB_SV-6-1598 [hydrothermal vent metagenome]|uniref:Uncharacterized protein n=1 Tax=hydrothermal vent metagenome TaxID=652676 RepID=A0A1W1C5N7_9ZZZZ